MGGTAGGRRVVDVSNPALPTEVGFYDGVTLYDVAVDGTIAYAAGINGMRVINVANPAAPDQLGQFTLTGVANAVALADQYAYLAFSAQGLRIIDVSTPGSPTEVGFYDTPGLAVDVAVQLGSAFVADWGSLREIDVHLPTSPVEIGSYVVAELDVATGVAVAGNYVYFASDDVEVLMICNVFRDGFEDGTPDAWSGVVP